MVAYPGPPTKPEFWYFGQNGYILARILVVGQNFSMNHRIVFIEMRKMPEKDKFAFFITEMFEVY